MKQYFMRTTLSELHFGDMIELTFRKMFTNGKVEHHRLECKFLPELVPLLLENDIIIEKEVKDAKKEMDKGKEKPFDSPNDALIQSMLKTTENLEHRLEMMEDVVMKIADVILKKNRSKHCHGAKKADRK